MNGSFGNVWKIIFMVTGAILVVLGLVLCGYGIAKVVDYGDLIDEAFDRTDDDSGNEVSDSDESPEDNIQVHIPAAIIAGAGLITVIVVLLGCCGVAKENRVVLGIYIPVMLVLFICVGVCIIVLYVSESSELREKIKGQIKDYDPDNQGSNRAKAATKAMDAVQKTLKCCGVDSYEDWAENSYLINKRLKVPASCCHADGLADDVEQCTKDPDSKAEIFISCNEALNPFGREVGIIAIVMALIMVLNLVASCVVCVMAG